MISATSLYIANYLKIYLIFVCFRNNVLIMAHSTIVLLITLFISMALSELLIKDNAWHSWKEFHNKKYESDDEESLRYTIWNENMKTIKKHNSDPNSKFTLQMNHLGDMVHQI